MRIAHVTSYWPNHHGHAHYTQNLMRAMQQHAPGRHYIIGEGNAGKHDDDVYWARPCWSRHGDYVDDVVRAIRDVRADISTVLERSVRGRHAVSAPARRPRELGNANDRRHALGVRRAQARGHGHGSGVRSRRRRAGERGARALSADAARARRARSGRCTDSNFFVHSDAPPGTGLGSSGAISVLMVALINRAFNLGLTRDDIAQLAYSVEHDDLGRAVGRQDHYAAAFGGMNYMEFSSAGTLVMPLRVQPWILEELVYHGQLFYTKKKRDSEDLVAKQIASYREKREPTLDALAQMKQLTHAMRRCLLEGEMRRFGELLHAGWAEKKRMNPDVANPYLDELYAAARDAGAIGGKLLGAGGGGFFLLYTPFVKQGRVAQAMAALGAQAVPFVLDERGVQTWEVTADLHAETDGLFERVA